VATALALALIVALLLLANGRPIPAGDTRPTEHLAASLVQEGDLDLDEYPELEPPFVREERAHKVSIYPVLSAVLAAPVFLAARLAFSLDETGVALAGKLASALFSGLAAAALFVAAARRRGEANGVKTALLFAFGTSVWSTSQALWQHPAAVLFLSVAILWMLRAEDEDAWAGRVGLPLSLAVAARHADLAIALVLAAGVAIRWPRRIPALALWSLPGPLLVLSYQSLYFGSPLRHGFSGSLGRFSETWGVGQLGLLLSPAKGLLVFTPLALIALVGLVDAIRYSERWLAATLGAAALAHLLLMGRWTEWHGGESWGPRMMTDALPLLFLFVTDGLDRVPALGAACAALSVAVQALGAFAYDYRWERLYQRPADPGRPELWRIADSPLLLHARERALILALPAVKQGRAFIREQRVVPLGPQGSRVSFEGNRLVVRGGEATMRDIHLQAGARLDDDKLRLKGRWDGLFVRVVDGARVRPLELRIDGRGRGTLYVGERSFWSDAPRWKSYAMNGALRVRHPFRYLESRGPDLLVTLGKSQGEAAITRIALVPPGEPEDVLSVE
jgi:hypothetical protein